jgi:hypothetical protein
MRYKAVVTMVVAAMAWSGTVLATTPSVTSLSYPERESVDLTLAKTSAAPDKAKLSGSVRYESGQAKVTVQFSGMEPAVLFGGDIAAYVVWAVAKSAAPENLGELIVDKKGD